MNIYHFLKGNIRSPDWIGIVKSETLNWIVRMLLGRLLKVYMSSFAVQTLLLRFLSFVRN